MRKFDMELMVGIFIAAGLICLSYLTIKLGKMEVMGAKGYEIHAVFSNSGGLKPGSPVIIAGVDVGRVKQISLEHYQARTVLHVTADVKIQEDAIASVRTKGLIGEKYIEIAPGGSEKTLPPGGTIRETEPAVDLEQLLSKYIFGKI
jgi:phospholipid/cholesterol/gamma-HCH transport system substrate-binding protein